MLQIIKAFLDAFRAHVTTGSTTQRLEWSDLGAQKIADSDYHLACIVARCFDLQSGGSVHTWDGKNAPRAQFALPIDVDELIDVINPDDLIAKRRDISYVRLHLRKVIAGEITGHIRRAVEHIHKIFVRTGSWPLSRTLRVELAKEGIDLKTIATGRFARGLMFTPKVPGRCWRSRVFSFQQRQRMTDASWSGFSVSLFSAWPIERWT